MGIFEHALTLLTCLVCLFMLGECFCDGTVLFRPSATNNRIFAVTTQNFGGVQVSSAYNDTGINDSSAGIGASYNLMCYLTISPAQSICKQLDSLSASPSTNSVPGSVQAQYRIALDHIQLRTMFVRLATTLNRLHAVDGIIVTYDSSTNVARESDTATVGAWTMANIPGNTYFYQYDTATGYLSGFSWAAGVDEAAAWTNSPLDSIHLANEPTVLVRGGNNVFYDDQTNWKALTVGETPFTPRAVSATPTDAPGVSASPSVASAFASTSVNCSSVLVRVNDLSTQHLYLWNPLGVTQADRWRIVVNGTKLGLASIADSFAWTDYLLQPNAPPPPPLASPTTTTAPMFEEGAGCFQDPPEPASAFRCDNTTGKWTSTSSFSSTEVVISSPVIIIGDLNVTTTVTFNGLGATINATGCIVLQGDIVISLTDEEYQSLVKTRSLQSILVVSGCDTSPLSQTPITVITPSSKKKCQSVSASTSSSSNTLTAVFKMNASKCNTWWIILVSVIGGVIVITVIVIALVGTFNKSFKAKMRPFWVRNEHTGPQI